MLDKEYTGEYTWHSGADNERGGKDGMATQVETGRCRCGSVLVGAGWCQSVRTHGTHLAQHGKWLCEVCGWYNLPKAVDCASCDMQKETEANGGASGE